MNLLKQNVGKQRKENYGKITKISASLAFLALPVEQKITFETYN